MKTYLLILGSFIFTTLLFSQNAGFISTQIPSLTTGRIDARAALVVGERLVVFGGHIPGFHRSNTAESIREGDNAWTVHTMTDYRDNSAIVHLGNSKYLLAGGMSASLGVGQLATTEIFDATTNQFTAKASMNVARGNCRAALLTSGKALLVGNWYADGTKAEVYDPVADTFTLTSSMVKERASSYVVPLPNGNAIVMGGIGSRGGDVENVELYDAATFTFSQLRANLLTTETGWIYNTVFSAAMSGPEDRISGDYFYFPAIKTLNANLRLHQIFALNLKTYDIQPVVSDLQELRYDTSMGDSISYQLHGNIFLDKQRNRIYFWGFNKNTIQGTSALYALYSLDISTGKVTKPIPGIRFDFDPSLSSGGILPDGRIVVAGGRISNNFDAHPQCYLIIPDGVSNEQVVPQAGFEIEAVPDLNTARMDTRGALFADNTYIVFGGHQPGFTPLNTAERWKPGESVWTTMTMTSIRDGCASARIDGNRVMLAGGMSTGYGVGQLSSTEIYDFSTNTFTPGPAMNVARTLFSGARLANGELLFVGNWYNDASKSEIYNVSTNSFRLTGNVIQPRSSGYIIPRSDNGAIILGGVGPYGGYVEKVEVFNHSTNTFTELRASLLANETGWYTAFGYPNNSCFAEEFMIDGKYYLSAFKTINSTTTAFMILSVDPDNLKIEPVITNTDLFTYTQGEALYTILAGKIMVDRNRKRLYFWVNHVLENQTGSHAMSLYYYDLVNGKLVESEGYKRLEYFPLMGSSVVMESGKLLITGGNMTSNFDAHPHCFIANPFGVSTGNSEVQLNEATLKVYSDGGMIRLLSTDLPAGLQQLSIIDVNGSMIAQFPVKLYEGINSLTLPVKLSKGIYILRLNTESTRFIVH